MTHHQTCRCDDCVLLLANKSLVAAILSRLGLHGAIEDSCFADNRARLAIARGVLDWQEKGGTVKALGEAQSDRVTP